MNDTEKNKLIAKVIKSDDFSDDEKIELVKALTQETTFVPYNITYPAYPVYPKETPYPSYPWNPVWYNVTCKTVENGENVTNKATC